MQAVGEGRDTFVAWRVRVTKGVGGREWVSGQTRSERVTELRFASRHRATQVEDLQAAAESTREEVSE